MPAGMIFPPKSTSSIGQSAPIAQSPRHEQIAAIPVREEEADRPARLDPALLFSLRHRTAGTQADLARGGKNGKNGKRRAVVAVARMSTSVV